MFAHSDRLPTGTPLTIPSRASSLVVHYGLDQRKVGENRVVVGRKDGLDLHGRDIAPGDGWSRALYAPECTWPQGAHLCVLVEWHPNRRVGSDWTARQESVTSGLRSLGYVVERAGRPIVPANDLYASLLVYRRRASLRLSGLTTRGRMCLPRGPTPGRRPTVCSRWSGG